MRILLFTFFIILAASVSGAQTISRDSAMVESASTDAKNFKLDGSNFKKFKAHHFPATSDYFKPTPLNVSDTTFLKDSTYVKTFRQLAYNKTLHRRTTGHSVLLIGGISVAVVAIVGLIALGSSSWGNQ
ncbi:hypothetical protein SNE25_14255 [Mucilaginibacter sabulilitoris]|uniref:RxLR effector protein n=1 Tax=Mucilaginibacter sabulilitoris TaxID=1173583 RepID=A0ABZ0TWZ8_9SPHI|nr:hypothetical protein [Mucilaginibacter sabulilitoris]WPU96683.1 hypothetical protein SNE25_14255 [Mucilaginibacter sabulilitoris]